MLEIAVQDDHGVAGSALQSGGNRDLVAEIARQDEHPHPGVVALQRLQNAQRGVPAAVVDIEDLEAETGDSLKGGDEAAVRLADDRFFVEAGNDDGQKR